MKILAEVAYDKIKTVTLTMRYAYRKNIRKYDSIIIIIIIIIILSFCLLNLHIQQRCLYIIWSRTKGRKDVQFLASMLTQFNLILN